MDKIFNESGYTFDFSESISAYVADRPTYHDLSAVDFVVETDNSFILIEVKNGDNKKATVKSQLEFHNELSSPAFPYQMGDKYKDVLLREWSKNKLFDKPIICVLIFEFNSFAKTEKAKLKEKIFSRIPFTLNLEPFCNRELIKEFKFLTVDEFRDDFPEFLISEE